jgi:hypothetical protein
MLGIGRGAEEAPAAPRALPRDDALMEDGGAWHSAFELPGGDAAVGGGTQRRALSSVGAFELPGGDAQRRDAAGGGGYGGGTQRRALSSVGAAGGDAHRRDAAGGGGYGGAALRRAQPAPTGDDGDEEEEEAPAPRRRPYVGAGGGSRGRIEVKTSVTSFADFLASQKEKKTYQGGPGRSAAPVKRWLTRAEATLALSRGIAAQRAAYAWAYGFATTSGNLRWLRNKIEEAVRDEGEEEEEEEEEE